MERRLIITGIAGTFLLGICLVAVMGFGLVGWFMVTPEVNPSPEIRRIILPPVATPATPTKKIAKSPPGLVEAAIEQPRATDTPTALIPTATASPTPTQDPTATPSATATHGPTPVPSPVTLPNPVVGQAGVATRLVIPKLGLDSPVVFAPVENGTWKVNHLGQAVGHLEGTAPPGSTSNIALAGHVTLAEGVYGPFARLSQLAPGDTLIVYEGEKEFFYIVDGYQTVDRDTVQVAYPSTSGKITLITCTNWNTEEGRYVDRLVVRGSLF